VPLSQVTVVNPTSIATIQWTTTNASSLTGSTTFTPTYTPSAADITAGFANLVLTVTPIAPCATPIVKTIRVNITKKATGKGLNFDEEGAGFFGDLFKKAKEKVIDVVSKDPIGSIKKGIEFFKLSIFF
jgi:hypothetical protein